MHPLPSRLTRSALRQAKALFKSTRFGRNLLSDLNNSDEFTSLLAHERMLADAVRVDSYHTAISRAVKPGDVVIDLGTGTGILALFAARQQARKVYALDHSDFIDTARRIAEHNGIGNVEFIASNSRDFNPPQRVDLIIHEQIGDELFTENMLENLLDLKRRALKPGGRILPARFELYVEPARLNPGRELPFLWERPVHGIDFSLLRDDPQIARYLPPDYRFPLLEPAAVDHWLCEPEPLITLDLNQMTTPDEMPNVASATRRVVNAGMLDGLVVWFRVIFDEDIGFDTSPLSRLTHWRSRLFRTPQQYLPAGAKIAYDFCMEDPANANSWTLTLHDGVKAPAGTPLSSVALPSRMN